MIGYVMRCRNFDLELIIKVVDSKAILVENLSLAGRHNLLIYHYDLILRQCRMRDVAFGSRSAARTAEASQKLACRKG
jgi:hypothetical protein